MYISYTFDREQMAKETLAKEEQAKEEARRVNSFERAAKLAAKDAAKKIKR